MCDLKEYNFQQGHGVKVRFSGGVEKQVDGRIEPVFFFFLQNSEV